MRTHGAVPATIAVLGGVPHVGLTPAQASVAFAWLLGCSTAVAGGCKGAVRRLWLAIPQRPARAVWPLQATALMLCAAAPPLQNLLIPCSPCCFSWSACISLACPLHTLAYPPLTPHSLLLFSWSGWHARAPACERCRAATCRWSALWAWTARPPSPPPCCSPLERAFPCSSPAVRLAVVLCTAAGLVVCLHAAAMLCFGSCLSCTCRCGADAILQAS